MAQQYDIFGNLVDDEEFNSQSQNNQKTKTMQQKFGEFKGFKCKECKYCKCIEQHFSPLYACKLWNTGNEYDFISPNDVACKQFANK